MSENESYLDWVTVENFRDFEDSGYTDEEILGMAQLLIEKAIPCLPKIQGKLSGPEKDLIKNAIFEMARYLKNEESNFDQATSPFQSETLGCVDDLTEILTIDGWKTREQLRVGDIVLTISEEDGKSYWQPVLHIYEYGAAPRPVLHIESKRFSSLTSMGHRWLLQDKNGRFVWRESEDLVLNPMKGEKVPQAVPHGDFPEYPTLSDDLVELIAWCWTEGGFGWEGHHSGIKIHQSLKKNPENCARIRSSLEGVFGSGDTSLRKYQNNICSVPDCLSPARARGRCSSHYMVEWRNGTLSGIPANPWSESTRMDGEMAVFSISAKYSDVVLRHLIDLPGRDGKAVSTEFLRSLTRSQLELFIRVSELADGSGPKQIAQKSRVAAEQFQLACTLAGKRTSIHQNKYGMWCVTYTDSYGITPHGIAVNVKYNHSNSVYREEIYDGVLWCPRTPNGTWLAKRNGTIYFTGNSYSYSKLLSRVKDSKDTGVPAFDRAVDMLSDLCLESVDEFGNTVSGMFTVSSERVFQPGYHNRRNTITHDRDWWSVGRDYVTKNWR